MKNGTNLICPRGTVSERGSWCLGQCSINLANKELISEINPVIDVINVSSLSKADEYLMRPDVGSLAERLAKSKAEEEASVPPNRRRMSSTNDPKLFLNAAKRDYDIVGAGIWDTIHT